MLIFLKTLTGKTIAFYVKQTETVQNFKDMIQNKVDIPT